MTEPTIDEMLEWLNNRNREAENLKTEYPTFSGEANHSAAVIKAIRAILEQHTTPILWEPDIDNLTLDELRQLEAVANNIGIDCMRQIRILEGQIQNANTH